MISWRLVHSDMILSPQTTARYIQDGTIRTGIHREAQIIADTLKGDVRVMDDSLVCIFEKVSPA